MRVYVTKELVLAFSCAYIKLWMHLLSLEGTQEAYLVLSKLPACIHNSIYTRYQSMNQFRIQELVLLLLKTPVCYSLSIYHAIDIEHFRDAIQP